ncbi:hypothetical protein HYALB_00012251 [Hymenoscyphus albidus]|uniref:2EXR domain-containing protein n=1 Tax=Hymenoscyphus albidus TaxID=595503 RepID=A0A9N9LQZ4_9HELO|nr:hypothetical protein HYALB_00012251 [Hymenoscyphus albidus]
MDTPETPEEFTRFPSLPPELRLRIWSIHLKTPRIVEVFVPREGRQQPWGLPSYTWTTQIPPVFHVNRESRYEAMKFFQMLRHVRGSGYLVPTMIVNFKIDTVFFSQWNQLIEDLLGDEKQDIALRIRSLAIPLHHRAPYAPFGCPNLRELVVLVCPRMYSRRLRNHRVWYREYREVEEVSDIWEREGHSPIHQAGIYQDREGESCFSGVPVGGEIWDFNVWDFEKLRACLSLVWASSYAKGIFQMKVNQYCNVLDPGVPIPAYIDWARGQATQAAKDFFKNSPRILDPPVLRINRGVAEHAGNWSGGKIVFAKPLDRQNRKKVVYNEMTGVMTFRLGPNSGKVVYNKDTGVMKFRFGDDLNRVVPSALLYYDGRHRRILPR